MRTATRAPHNRKRAAGHVRGATGVGPLGTKLAVLALLALPSCSDSEGPSRACPPDGIAVTEFEGISPGEQAASFREYSCSQPQICPDEGGAFFHTFVVIPDCEEEGTCPAPTQINLNLTNCSTGKEKLVIDRVELYGNERCYFTQDVAIEQKEVSPGEMIAIKTDWYPRAPGEDHAQFRIFSNAQNYSPLIVAFCGRAITRAEVPRTTADGGVASDAQAGLPPLTCRAVTEPSNCTE